MPSAGISFDTLKAVTSIVRASLATCIYIDAVAKVPSASKRHEKLSLQNTKQARRPILGVMQNETLTEKKTAEKDPSLGIVESLILLFFF